MDIRFSGVIKRINYISQTTTTHGTPERRKARKIMHTPVPRFWPEQWSPEEDHTSVEKSNKKQRKWRSNSKSHKSYLHDIFRGKDSRCLHMLLLRSDTQLAGLNFDPKLPKKLQQLHWDVSLVSPHCAGESEKYLGRVSQFLLLLEYEINSTHFAQECWFQDANGVVFYLERSMHLAKIRSCELVTHASLKHNLIQADVGKVN